MGWLSKAWAALVALFLRSPKVDSVPDIGIPVSIAPIVAQLIDHPAPVIARSPNLGNATAIDPGTDLYSATGSPLKALLDQMETAFPVPSIKPGSDMASLQYAAGQRAVVDWVRMKQKRGQA